MEVFDAEGVFDGDEGAFVGGFTVLESFFDAAPEHEDAGSAGEVAVLAVVLHLGDDVDFVGGLIAGIGARDAFDHHVAAELAGDDDEGAVEHAALFEVPDELGDGEIDLRLDALDRFVTFFVSVPSFEGLVFGGDFDEASTGFGEAAREEAALAKAALTVWGGGFFGFLGEVKGGSFLGAEEAVSFVHGAEHGFLLEGAGALAGFTFGDEFLVELVAIGEAAGGHAFGWLDRSDRLVGVGEEEGAEFAAEESAGVEGLEFFFFAHAFESLSDIDEGGHGVILLAEDLGHPGTDVGGGDGLGRDVSGVPMILVA